MLFVRVGNHHINMEAITGFCWRRGHLVIHNAPAGSFTIEDPDRSEYKKLCEAIGVREIPEE